MNYQSLRAVIPKKSDAWRVSDVEKWLRFIHLDPYISKFRAMCIDGSNLKALTDEDFKQQLHITSKVIIKKLKAWIPQGLQQFDHFLDQLNEVVEIPEDSQIQTQPSEPSTYMNDICLARSRNKRQKEQCLIMRRLDINEVSSYYKFVEANCRLGMDSNCEIQVQDENVDLVHSEISFRYPHFYLKNKSTLSGTFLKVDSRVPIQQKMHVEMGANLFAFHLCPANQIQIQIVNGKNVGQKFYYEPTDNKITVGRRSNNSISIGGDSTLSNMHAKISFFEGQWLLEDLGSTNGTWTILRSEIKIQTGLVFKLGLSNYQYECETKEQKSQQEATTISEQKIEQRQICTKCKEENRNIVFYPCNHLLMCEECSQNSQNCPRCRSKITRKIKIFRP